MTPRIRKAIAAVVSVVYFTTQVALASAAESNIWAERRQNQATQLAALPTSPLLNQLPSITNTLPIAAPKSQFRVSGKFQNLIDAIPLTYGAIQDVFDAHNQKSPIVLIQDIHMNNEAQTNIAAMLQQLIDQKQVGVIGVEGAFSSFDFKPFRKYPNKEITKAVVQDFMDKNLLAAPSYVGITSTIEPPLFVGVDDRQHYDANLEALYSSRDQKDRVIKDLTQKKQTLIEAKRKFFSKELTDFDNLRTAYHKGDVGFGQYVKKLSRHSRESGNPVFDMVLEQFLEAYEMESSLDLKRVETERRIVIERLTHALTEKEISRLVAESLAYRMGRIGFGTYYQNLKDLCATKNIPLTSTPNFENYIRYVLLSDGIKADALFKSVEKLEETVVADLAKTDDEKKLVTESEQLSLSEKLVDFSLTPPEWEKYQTSTKDLAPFENFYKQADIRSHKMLSNLLVANPQSLVAALVVGGFHSPQIAELLRKEKISYVVVTPKLTKIDNASGSAYLSVFAREKTPLDRLFAGEKLFLNDITANIPHLQKATIVSGVVEAEQAAHGLNHLTNQIFKSDGKKTYRFKHEGTGKTKFLHTSVDPEFKLQEALEQLKRTWQQKPLLLTGPKTDKKNAFDFLTSRITQLTNTTNPNNLPVVWTGQSADPDRRAKQFGWEIFRKAYTDKKVTRVEIIPPPPTSDLSYSGISVDAKSADEFIELFLGPLSPYAAIGNNDEIGLSDEQVRAFIPYSLYASDFWGLTPEQQKLKLIGYIKTARKFRQAAQSPAAFSEFFKKHNATLSTENQQQISFAEQLVGGGVEHHLMIIDPTADIGKLLLIDPAEAGLIRGRAFSISLDNGEQVRFAYTLDKSLYTNGLDTFYTLRTCVHELLHVRYLADDYRQRGSAWIALHEGVVEYLNQQILIDAIAENHPVAQRIRDEIAAKDKAPGEFKAKLKDAYEKMSSYGQQFSYVKDLVARFGETFLTEVGHDRVWNSLTRSMNIFQAANDWLAKKITTLKGSRKGLATAFWVLTHRLTAPFTETAALKVALYYLDPTGVGQTILVVLALSTFFTLIHSDLYDGKDTRSKLKQRFFGGLLLTSALLLPGWYGIVASGGLHLGWNIASFWIEGLRALSIFGFKPKPAEEPYMRNTRVKEILLEAQHTGKRLIGPGLGDFEQFRQIYSDVEEVMKNLLRAQGLDTNDYRLFLVDDMSPNAAALTHYNVITVNLGLLRLLVKNGATKDALAFILAHEITHIQQGRDKVDQGTADQSEGFIDGMLRTRGREYEADLAAVSLMDKAGYSVREAPVFFQALLDWMLRAKLKDSLLGNHPQIEERLRKLHRLITDYHWNTYLLEPTAFDAQATVQGEQRTRYRNFQEKVIQAQSAKELESVLREASTAGELQFAMLIGFEGLPFSEKNHSDRLENIFRERSEELAAGDPAKEILNEYMRDQILTMIHRRSDTDTMDNWAARATSIPTAVLIEIIALGVPDLFFINVDNDPQERTDRHRQASTVLSFVHGAVFLMKGPQMPNDRFNMYATGFLETLTKELGRSSRKLSWAEAKKLLNAFQHSSTQTRFSNVSMGALRIQQLMMPFVHRIVTSPDYALEMTADDVREIIDLFESSLSHALLPEEAAANLHLFALRATPAAREAVMAWATHSNGVSTIRDAFISYDIKKFSEGKPCLLNSNDAESYVTALLNIDYVAAHYPKAFEEFLTVVAKRSADEELVSFHKRILGRLRQAGQAQDVGLFQALRLMARKRTSGFFNGDVFEQALLENIDPRLHEAIRTSGVETKIALYLFALGAVPKNSAFREWAFGHAPNVPRPSLLTDSKTALRTLQAKANDMMDEEEPAGLRERLERGGSPTAEDLNYLASKFDALEQNEKTAIWDEWESRYPKVLGAQNVSDQEFLLLALFLSSLSDKLGTQLAKKEASAEERKFAFGQYFMPIFLQALFVKLGNGKRLTEKDVKYSDSAWAAFSGDMTLEGATETYNRYKHADSLRPKHAMRLDAEKISRTDLLKLFAFIQDLPSAYDEAVTMVRQRLPLGVFRNFVLYLLFVDRILNKQLNLKIEGEDIFNLEHVLKKINALPGAQYKVAMSGLRLIIPLLVADRMMQETNIMTLVRFGGLKMVKDTEADDATLRAQHQSEVDAYGDAVYAVPGGPLAQLSIFTALLAERHLRAILAADVSLETKREAILAYFPQSSTARDRWLEMALKNTNFQGPMDEIVALLQMMAGSTLRETMALQALDRYQDQNPNEFKELDSAVAAILLFFPAQSPTRDDILAHISQDLVSTPDEYEKIAALLIDPFEQNKRLREKEEARLVFGRDSFRDFIKKRSAFEKAQFLLWLFGIINKKPLFIIDAEFQFHIRFDHYRDLLAPAASRNYPDAGITAQKEFLEPFLYGNESIFSDNNARQEFLQGLFDAVVPTGPLKKLFQRIFMTALEKASPGRREIIVISLLRNLSSLRSNTTIKPELKEAKAVAAFLQSLGLIGVKLGQFISGLAGISAEMKEELGNLRDQAKPINKGVVFDLLKKLFGPFEQRFMSVGKLVGRASIKVVYLARLRNGQEVVLKVKRPDVEKTVEEDLEFMADVINDIRPYLEQDGITIPKRLVNSISAAIRKELNFVSEALNTRQLRSNLSSWNPIKWGLNTLFRFFMRVNGLTASSYTFGVPNTLRLGNNSVIIEELARGIPLSKITDQEPAERAIAIELFRQIFVDGYYHADPHLGNAFADGSHIDFIDAGAVGKISWRGRVRLLKLMRALVTSNIDGLMQVLHALAPPEKTNPLRSKINDLLQSPQTTVSKTLSLFQLLEENNVPLPDEFDSIFRLFAAAGGILDKAVQPSRADKNALPAAIIAPTIKWLNNYGWMGKTLYAVLVVGFSSVGETLLFHNGQSWPIAMFVFAAAHTIVVWAVRAFHQGWKPGDLKQDLKDFSVRSVLGLIAFAISYYIDPQVTMIAHALYNGAVLADMLPKWMVAASIFDKLKILLGGSISEDLSQNPGKPSSVSSLRRRFEQALAQQDVPAIQRIIADAGKLSNPSDAIDILLQISQLNLVPVIMAATRELERIFKNNPDAKTGQAERTLTRIASTLQSSGYRNEAQFISSVASSEPGARPTALRKIPSSEEQNKNGLPQFEIYLNGLKEGRVAYSLEMPGSETAQQLGFGSGFAELYDRLSELVKEQLRSLGGITIEQVIALGESVVKKAEARRTKPSAQRESDQSERGPATTRVINPADESSSGEQSIAVDEFSRVRIYQTTPAAEMRLIENFLAAYGEFVVALSRGNGNGARAAMISSARTIDPTLARAVENLAQISQSDLWANGDAVLRQAKVINEYLISKGYYLYANVINDGRKALYMSTYYRIVEARLYPKNGLKVVAIHLERLDKLNIDEARLGHSAGDGLAVVMRDKIRTNVLNTVLPGLGQAIDASWDVDLPSSLMSSASRLVEQDLLQILTTPETAKARLLGDLLGQRARLMRKLNALLKPYGASIYSHSLELLINAETLSTIQQWASQIGQGKLAREILRINQAISDGKNDHEAIVEKIIAASARSVEIHELTHEFDRDRTRVEPVAYSNQLALSPTFGIDLVHLMQHVIRPMGRDENEAAATILRGLGTQLLGTQSIADLGQIELLFDAIRQLAPEERNNFQIRAHQNEFGPLLVTKPDIENARSLAAIIAPLFTWLNNHGKLGKVLYAVMVVGFSSVGETLLFHNGQNWLIATFVFAAAHTIVVWAVRAHQKGWKPGDLKQDLKDFSLRSILGLIAFAISYYIDPQVTMIAHALYNGAVLANMLPKWAVLGSIVPTPIRKVKYFRGGQSGEAVDRRARNATIGEGIYLTDEASAQIYAKKRGGETGEVKAAFVTGRLLDMSKTGKLPDNLEAKWKNILEGKLSRQEWTVKQAAREALFELSKHIFNGNVVHGFTQDFTNFLMSEGYDGLIALEGGESATIRNHISVVIFDPKNVEPIEDLPQESNAQTTLRTLIANAAANGTARILCVCTMNYNRSPAMEAALRYALRSEGLQDKVTVTSAGLNVPGGRAANINPKLTAALETKGMSASGLHPKNIRNDDIRAADVIFAADERVYAELMENPQAHNNVILFTQLDPALPTNLPDPAGGEITPADSLNQINTTILKHVVPVIKTAIVDRPLDNKPTRKTFWEKISTPFKTYRRNAAMKKMATKLVDVALAANEITQRKDSADLIAELLDSPELKISVQDIVGPKNNSTQFFQTLEEVAAERVKPGQLSYEQVLYLLQVLAVMDLPIRDRNEIISAVVGLRSMAMVVRNQEDANKLSQLLKWTEGKQLITPLAAEDVMDPDGRINLSKVDQRLQKRGPGLKYTLLILPEEMERNTDGLADDVLKALMIQTINDFLGSLLDRPTVDTLAETARIIARNA